jgi:hypothetical protein
VFALEAVADLGALILLTIALLGVWCIWALTSWLRSYGPHFSVLGQGIDTRPWFDPALRMIEGWMHDIEASIETAAELGWLSARIVVAAAAKLEGFVTHDVVAPMVNAVEADLRNVERGLWTAVKDTSATVGNAEHGLVHTVSSIGSDIHYMNDELARVWTELSKLEKAAYHGLSGIEATVEHDVTSEIDKLLHGTLSDVATLKSDVVGIAHKMAAIESAIPSTLASDLPQLMKLAEELRHVGSLPSELAKLGARVGALEGDVRGIPRLAEHELTNLRELPHILEWVKPLITAGAITGALTQAWRLMREGECPCPSGPTVKLPGVKFGGSEADLIALDMVVKDGI